jgi:uncharacterized damage-inducible protein DinB
MPKTETCTLEPTPGMKSRLVGLFLAQLDDQNRNLAEDTRGLTPEELAWQPAPGMNTIGMLLAHIALVEVGWIGAAAKGLEFFKIDELPVRWADSGIPLAPEAAPPAALHGKDLAFYDDVMSRARAFTRKALAGLTDADLELRRTRIRRDGTEVNYNVGWALYHVLEHEAGHYGQINLLRHHYRLARAKV